jgi:hypothetical protein
MMASATVTDALTGIARLHHYLLDGHVTAVRESGVLEVALLLGAVTAGALIDHRFRAGEAVRLMWADDATYQVIGLAPTGALRTRAASLSVMPGPASSTGGSSSLAAAVQRYAAREAQLLKRGRITAVRADGALEVYLRSGAWPARAVTDLPFRVGMTVYAVRTDAGEHLVMGGR